MTDAFDLEDLREIDEIYKDYTAILTDAYRQIDGLKAMVSETVEDMEGFLQLAHGATTPQKRRQLLGYAAEAQKLKSDMLARIEQLERTVKGLKDAIAFLQT